MRTTQQQLSNLKELKGNLAKRKIASSIFFLSQRLVPVDSGELRNSGSFGEQSVSYSAGHAAYVEFGTIKMKSQPYLRPAMDHINMAEIAREVEKEIRGLL